MVFPIVITQWWNELSTVLQVFWGIALVFTILFAIQFVLSLIGLDMDTDMEVGVNSLDSDFELSAEFQLFSFRSIIAFFAFFGWIGIYVTNRSGQLWMALILATLGGLVAMSTIAYLMYLMSKLEEEGTVFIDEALYNVGEVYLTIPERKLGKGKIHVNVRGALKEVDAMTSGPSIPTGTKIKVVEIINKHTVLVEDAKEMI